MAERQYKKPSAAKNSYLGDAKPKRPHSGTRKGNTEIKPVTKEKKSDMAASRSHYNDKDSAMSTIYKVQPKVTNGVESKQNPRNVKDESYDLASAYIVTYEGKKYDLSNIQTDTHSELVASQTSAIEEKLRLKRLGNDLSSLGKFVRLACCGVVGHTDLQIKMRHVLVNIGDITDHTYHTLKDFDRASESALETMEMAYGFLKEDLEEETLSMFKQIHESSVKMHKIANELSDKCKTQSDKVGEVGEETLKEKEATEIKKKEADLLIDQSEIVEKHQKEIMQASLEQTDRKEKVVSDALDNKKEVFKAKTKLAKEFKEKKESKSQDVKQRKAEVKYKYDADCNEITRKIRETQQEYEKVLTSGRDAYNTKLKELDTELKNKITYAEKAYEKEVQQIKEEFDETKRENDRSYKCKVKEHREKYEKTVSDAESEYQFAISQADKDYESAIQISNDELEKKLRLATQELETALSANSQTYSAEVEASSSKAEVHDKWSKKDAASKKAKSDAEDAARSEKINAHKRTHENRDGKLQRAFRDKQHKIEQAEKDKKLKDSEASEELKTLNNKAMEAKREQMDAAERKKSKAISDAHNRKKEDEQKAKEAKEITEKCAKDIKETEDNKNVSEKEDAFKKYQFDLKELDDELAKAEKLFEDDYQKELKIMDEKFQDLKETSSQYESDIKDLQKQREEAYQQMLQFAQQLKDGIESSEGHETSIQCLHEAKSALHHIQVITKKASTFWTDVGRHCESMIEGGLKKHLQAAETSKDSVSRKKIYNTKSFKTAALKYAGQWKALKETCSTASEHITLVQEEINGYLCENPTKEEAVELVKKLATDMLGSAKKMISDKSANN